MADQRKIVIEIIEKGGDQGGSKSGGGGKREDNPNTFLRKNLEGLFHPMNTLEKNLSDEAQWGIELGKQALSLAYDTALFELNRKFTLKEDYIGQNKLNMFTQTIGVSRSILSSTTQGAIMGAQVGGIYGAIFGAITGAGMSIFKAQKAAMEKLEQYQMQLNATNKQTTFGERRASLVNGGKGTEY